MKYERKERGHEGKKSQTLLLLYTRLKGLYRCGDVAKDRNTRGTSSMDRRVRGSHTRSVYHTQYTSRVETVRVKDGVGADTK